MVDLVWLVPALPLAGFLLLLALGRRLGDPMAGWLATLVMFGSFAVSVVVFFGLLDLPEEERHAIETIFQWVPAGALQVDVSFLVDPLSVTMILFVTGVGALIHLYSIGYMHGDENFSKFFVYLNLFAFSMLVLVLGENLLLTFVGWEGVGACSYFLISFWFTKDANAVAGKKAFVTNRIGDWGFLLAMFVAFAGAGTLSYEGLFEAAEGGEMAAITITAVAFLLFVGACGKSAQLPLYVWLPDAMAGPTPVSALIHAATMVTAGVFLMTRVNPLLATGYDWLPTLIAWVGVLTALLAATIAIAQNDIKKVLAYSTISQLGYMFLAVGVGGYVAAIFHMVTHAFFKALLFLGAGSVIHGMHEEQDMRRMGALRKLMPITAATMIVGWLAIAGVPPFAGFWSKDEILLFAYNENVALWAIGLLTALLTAFYMSRQVFMVFFGEPHWKHAEATGGEAEQSAAEVAAGTRAEHSGEQGAAVATAVEVDPLEPQHAHGEIHPHESPWLMTVPLVVLAILSIIGGALNLPFDEDYKFLEHWLHPSVELGEAELDVSSTTKIVLAVIAIVIALTGIAIAAQVYLRRKVAAARFELPLFAHAWYFDESISRFMAGPGRRTFDAMTWFDAHVIDGAINGVAGIVSWFGGRLRRTQTGYVRNYALEIAAGTIIIVGLFLLMGA
jgi:NADH-quinone oxidoreductase subunit L